MVNLMKEVFKNNKLIILFSFSFLILITFIVYTPKSIKAEESIKNNFLYDKIIVIGDSRMELIANREDYSEKLPDNMHFIAKSGRCIEWFNQTAIKKLHNLISNENIAVVINMGVNDLQVEENPMVVANKYSHSFQVLSKFYDNVDFFIMSINPINEVLIQKHIETNIRTNNNIEIVNNNLSNFINDSEINNLKFCDAYNNITFNTNDGLHYTEKTNKKIIEYILNDCLKK